MTPLLDRRLIFVSGKGGVGKSTIAAGLALLAAQQGKKVLLGEVDSKGNLADSFECGPTEFKPREIQPNLHLMSMDTEDSLKEYLALQLKVPLLARIGPLARTFEFVANAAPGVKEILTVGKFVYEVRDNDWDLVVVDAAATGHIIGQLTAPQSINELVQVGLVRNQTDWMVKILHDHELTGLVVVTTPEEMPVNETVELVAALGEKSQVDLAGIVVNRVLPELFSRAEEELFERLRESESVAVLADAAGGSVEPVLEAARLAVTLRRTRAEHLARLREKVERDTQYLYVPYLFARTHGLRATHKIAEALGAELGF
jgi:anion-transporting  ArsA/GET3 family ATPase